jgi:hypothetical protein
MLFRCNMKQATTWRKSWACHPAQWARSLGTSTYGQVTRRQILVCASSTVVETCVFRTMCKRRPVKKAGCTHQHCIKCWLITKCAALLQDPRHPAVIVMESARPVPPHISCCFDHRTYPCALNPSWWNTFLTGQKVLQATHGARSLGCD